MNALPLKTRSVPGDIIDELIADHGFIRVLSAIAARLIKRSRPPDALTKNRLHHEPRMDVLSDHLRRDLGLPPEAAPKAYVDLSVWTHRSMF